MNVFVKLLGTNIPPGEIAFARGFFGTVCGAHYYVCEGHHSFSKEDRGLLVMRGLYGGFGMVCNFIALVHIINYLMQQFYFRRQEYLFLSLVLCF